MLVSRHVRTVTAASLFTIAVSIVGGCQELSRELGSSSGDGADASPPADSTDGGTVAEGGVIGAGCGTEQQSGAQLCIATSICPNVVVDTGALPGCGFRVRGSVVDLVCACGSALCPMGNFTTCDEASKLLSTQTESSVCVQVAEGRCTTVSGSSSSSSSSSSGGKNPACDSQCVKDCGGGAACAAVCNCD